MRIYLVIAVGGALGSMLRLAVNNLIVPHLGAADGWISILAINVTGSFLIGLLFALTAPDGRWPSSPATQLFLLSGICGGYTTFSAFSLQTVTLLRGGLLLRAGANIGGSVALCLLGAWLGQAAGALLAPVRG